ncbi:MAG: thioredoxin domain-containing protein [Dehalococcoidia bacterium]|nr:thioredoxin domain-containing protein [Dehalococcoidia bacterium]
MPNRLANETSPYLLQHAHNPVDWYPWGPEALERAKREDKPIFLSIGYSACHWCHVMERESFEDGAVARIMNERYVNVKVDREERPDIDSIYMQTVQSITGHGGWPLSVFLTPDLKPFYGGTYFPPDDRHGVPSFRRLLEAVSNAYATQRAEIVQTSNSIAQALQNSLAPLPSTDALLTPDTLTEAFQNMASQFDSHEGGFGQAPKFPQPMTFEFLLSFAHRSGEQLPLLMTELTLEKMAFGGMYDQLGGGFHRYSTDQVWLVPHFEKMLYDNALLARLYLHGYQYTKEPLYKRVVTETLDYVLREMRGSEGQFYSAQDADSEGVEGKFFVWGYDELRRVLPEDQRELVTRLYGVTSQGNFDGRNILHVAQSLDVVAAALGIPIEEAQRKIKEAQSGLLALRSRRVAPGTDTKALASWNALMLASMAEAGRVLGREDYVDAARQNAEFLLAKLYQNGRLLRTYRDGAAKLLGYLEDYANLIDGLLTLHGVTAEYRWLKEARKLASEMLGLFWDQQAGTFYDVGTDHEQLLVRPREIFDNATPAGGSMASFALLRLARITGNDELTKPALAMLRALQHGLAQHPNAFGHWLSALVFHLSPSKEIAVVGTPGSPETTALLGAAYALYLPNKVVAGCDSAVADGVNDVALLEKRIAVRGLPTAYVCEHYACQLPVQTADELLQQLKDRTTG